MSDPATPKVIAAPEDSVAGEVDVSAYPSDGGRAEAELVSRLRVIEEQPLATRAAAYASVHEELAKRLESAPADERA
ncbi:MAG TPA: hypothetical protein VFY91_13390 [Microbacterium sp.]|nr:hypothetical protein [Microbacterium sp.]